MLAEGQESRRGLAISSRNHSSNAAAHTNPANVRVIFQPIHTSAMSLLPIVGYTLTLSDELSVVQRALHVITRATTRYNVLQCVSAAAVYAIQSVVGEYSVCCNSRGDSERGSTAIRTWLCDQTHEFSFSNLEYATFPDSISTVLLVHDVRHCQPFWQDVGWRHSQPLSTGRLNLQAAATLRQSSTEAIGVDGFLDATCAPTPPSGDGLPANCAPYCAWPDHCPSAVLMPE